MLGGIRDHDVHLSDLVDWIQFVSIILPAYACGGDAVLSFASKNLWMYSKWCLH
ncbi:hypothetical protein HanIR_Chr10g0454671 [Helianthus annuus]|nr:hypothetical protein HanIR_Chr10g0454671 [Helianthus annuus]